MADLTFLSALVHRRTAQFPAAEADVASAEPFVQRRGVGSRLVRGGLMRLPEIGFEAASLLGDPAYYERFGFSPELAARIEAPHHPRGRGFQAIERVAGALDGKTVRG